MTFGSGNNPLTASVTHPPIANEDGYDDETESLLLTLKNAQGNTVFEKGLLINHDMFGSGFLKAMQVDDDPELEIVFCLSGFQNKDRAFSAEYFANHDTVSTSFYLDIHAGQVNVRDLMTTPQQVRDLAESRLLTLNPLFYIMFEIFLSPVFLIVGYILWMRLLKKL